MTKRKAVYLEWDDSASCAGTVWADREDVIGRGPSRCMTIGFILEETKNYITIVSSFDPYEDGQVAGDMSIPKSAIRKRRAVNWKA